MQHAVPALSVLLALLLAGCSGETACRLAFMDVGYGDAILLQAEGAGAPAAVLIDAGSSPGRLGRDVVLPFLARNSVRALDAVICTHSHEDHAGGIPAVLDGIAVSAFYSPPWRETNACTAAIEQRLAHLGIPRRILARGDRLAFGGCEVEVLWPPAGGADVVPPPVELNAHSLVLLLRCGDGRALLPADVTAAVLSALRAGAVGLQAAVLKIPHHGGRDAYSEAFLAAVSPAIAVLSVGENPWGNPSAEVVAAYERHTRVMRTDRDGTVRVLLDGSGRAVIE
ncbi:MBL fold metallo-hydrolase [bacterium]|nr:MBL fold metallo-hydrolase [bacterium]